VPAVERSHQIFYVVCVPGVLQVLEESFSLHIMADTTFPKLVSSVLDTVPQGSKEMGFTKH